MFLFETAKTYETVYAQSLLDVEITLDISDLMEYKKKTMSKTIVPNTQYDPNEDYHMIESKCKRCNNFRLDYVFEKHKVTDEMFHKYVSENAKDPVQIYCDTCNMGIMQEIVSYGTGNKN